jgi:hypothetical protein
MVELNSARDLPGFLIDLLPESREAVEQVVLDYRDTPYIAA